MKTIKFSKYHGCGNDFIIVENFKEDAQKLAKDICNRNTGVGADGFINLDTTNIKMNFYNQDGSIGTMCGNGLRCLSAYLLEKKLIKTSSFEVLTDAGKMKVEVKDFQKPLFKVNLGKASFDTTKLQIETNNQVFLNEELSYQGNTYICYAVFIGVKHLVIYVDNVTTITEEIGHYLSNHPLFKDAINVDFVSIINPNELRLKTYERGVGFTKACGTGAAASFVITNMFKQGSDTIKVVMDIDSLVLTKSENEEIIMQGTALKICDGRYMWRN